MKKSASSTNKKFGYLRIIGLTAFILTAAIFINALPNMSVQAATSSSFFGLADLLKFNGILMKEAVNVSEPAETTGTLEAVKPSDAELVTATTYPFAATTATLEDLTTGSTQLSGSGNDDTGSAVTNIGFDYYFDGVRYTQFSANPNGLMRLGSTAISNTFSNANFGTASLADYPVLAPYFDDLATGTNGNVRYKVIGSAPNRKLVVEWNVTVPRNTAGVANAQFQAWIFESAGTTTPGAVQFVYGNGLVANTANGGYTVGIASSATSFASVTTPATVSYATANNTQTTAITAGTSYTFTPQSPSGAPSALTVTNPTASSLRLNFTDNATNEVGFPIYTSTDNVTFTYFGQLGANAAGGATIVTLNGLAVNTTYFFRVYAVTEGVLSSFTSGSGMTNPPISGTKTIGAGGDYPTFTAAINDANAGTGAGGVTFNVAAGTTFAENSTCITGGSSTNPIIFQKSGTGANPIIQPPGSASTVDSGVCILGGDFITFDGIDIVVAVGNTTVERGYDIENLTATNGANNNTIRNTSITMNRANTSSFGIIQIAGVAPTSAAGTNNNNKYQNLTIKNVAEGILLSGSTAFQDTNNEVSTTSPPTFNAIGDPATANDIGNFAGVIYGIQTVAQNGVIIRNNEIQNITDLSTSSNVYGIYMNNTGSNTFSVGTNQISNNKIHDIQLTGASTTGVVYGIREDLTNNAASMSNVFNNFIYSLNTTSATVATRKIIGIGSQTVTGSGAASTHNINNNSVRIAPTSVTASNTCFELGTSSNIIKLQNNIFANFTSAQTGSAKHYTVVSTSATALGGAGTVSNFNNLYVANTTNGFVGLGSATDYATLANFRTAYGQDANSISTDPLFTSASDLHITGASPAIDTGTTLAAITTDIDNQTRPQGAAYDIGADEYVASPGVLQFNPTTYTGSEGATVNLTITRTSGTSGSVTVDVTLNNGLATGGAACGTGVDFVNPGVQTITLGNNVTSATVPVQLCSDAVGDPSESFTATLSNATGGATIGTNAGATVNIMDIAPPFNGSLSVGTGNPYTSLTNTGGIFEAINNSGATGNVVINITSDLTGETGAVALNQIAGGFTLTIKPSGGARAITGSSAAGLITLNGADFVTIDGSTSGGTDRSLTITQTNAGTSSAVIWLQTATGANGATNNVIKNLNIVGNTNVTTLFGIGMGSPTISTTGLGTGNNTNTIQNDNISKTQYGIYSQGASAAAKNTGNIITQNLMNTATPNNIQIGGVLVGFEDNIQITQNNIGGMSRTTSVFGIAAGFVTSDFSATVFTGNEVTNATISRNRIDNLTSTSVTGYSGVGIGYASAATGTTQISNNMISRVSDLATSPDFNAGIYVGGGAGSLQIYNNSVYLSGNRGAATFPSFALAIGGTTPIVDIRNNALENTSVSSNATGKSYAIGLAYSSTTGNYVNLTSNNNDFFTSGTSGAFARTGGLTGGGGTDRANLVALQTETGKDVNSLTVDPLFISTSDLHLQTTPMASPLLSQGTALASVTIDFDGDTRDATPDIGADEIVTAAPAGTIQFSATTYSVGEGGGNASLTVTRTGGSNGAISATYTFADSGATGGGVCGGAVDYVNTGGSVTFADGITTSQTILVPICDDIAVESSENFTATLAGAAVGTPATTTVTINDNDVANTPPTISAVDVSRVKGSAAINSQIASVSDANQTADTLSVTATAATGTGVTVTITGISPAGVVTANVAATCAATNSTFTLTVMDSAGATATAMLTVTVTDSTVPTQLVFGQQPTNTTAGSAISPAVTVRAVNSCGVLVSSYNGSISIALNGGGSLGGTTTAMASGGTATFSNLVVNSTAGARTLTATASGLTTATSNSFNVAAPTITLSPTSLPNGVTGTAYSQTITASGGAAAYTFAATGTLPNGLMLSTGGVLSGTPTTATTFNFTVTATDANGFTGSQAYTVVINAAGTPGVTVTPTTVNVTEGGATATYSVVLTTQPTANVTISITPDSQITVNPTTLTFTSANYNTAQTVTVTAVDDTVIEGNHTGTITQTAASADGNYNNIAVATVTANITDNDADAIAPTISYMPIPNENTPSNPMLTITVTDAVGVTNATIFFNTNGGIYTSAACSFTSGTAQNGTWSCPISGTASGQAIAYYVTAADAAGNTTANPAAGAAAPNLYTIGAAAIPTGSYTNISLSNGTTLNGNISVSGVTTLSGIVNTNGNTLTIGCNGSVAGAGTTSYVIGSVAKQYCTTGTFIYPVGTIPNGNLTDEITRGDNPNPEYTPFTANVTAVGINPSTLTVNAVDAALPGSDSGQSASRYWDVTETGDLTATISFTYLDEDVSGTETNYQVLRRSAGTTAVYTGGTVNAGTNTATAPNVSNFSQWSAGNLSPTAADADISGRVVNTYNRGLENVTVTLSGGSLTEPISVTTNNAGRYHFSEVPAGDTYILTVTSKRHTFAQPSQVFTVNSSLTNVNFVGVGW